MEARAWSFPFLRGLRGQACHSLSRLVTTLQVFHKLRKKRCRVLSYFEYSLSLACDEARLAAVQGERDRLQASVESIRQQVKFSDEALAEAVKSNEALREQMEIQRMDAQTASEREMKAWREKFQTHLQDQEQQHQAEQADLTRRVRDLEDLLGNKAGQIQALRENLAEKNKARESLLRDLTMWKAQHELASRMKADVERDFDHFKEEFLGRRLPEKRDEFEALRKKQADLEAKKASFVDEVQKLEREIQAQDAQDASRQSGVAELRREAFQRRGPMPSPWREVGERAYKEYTPARFEILELVVYSDDLKAQGTSLVGVLKKGEQLPSGLGFPGVFLGASDEYYRFWATEGEGRALAEKGTYHLCEVRVADCPQWKRRAHVVHSDKFRTVGPSEVRDGKISWLRSKENRERVVAALDKFEARVKRRSVTEEAIAPLERSEDESDGSSSSSGDSEEVRARLKRLKAELQVAQKKADKKSKKKDRTRKSRGRSVSRKKDKKDGTKKKDRRSPSSEEKAERKAAKKRKAKGGREEEPKKVKKKKVRETEEHSEDESSGSSESKQKELFKSSPPSKSLEKKPGLDRGPFGGGPALAYGRSDQSSDSEAESVFRDAPTRSTTQSGQQKLSRYSQRYPGRLASTPHQNEGSVGQGPCGGAQRRHVNAPVGEPLPPDGLDPSARSKSFVENPKGIEDAGKRAGSSGQGRSGPVCRPSGSKDKSPTQTSQEGHWASAQYLELLPPDGVTLLERDEELYLRQEYIIDRKAKQYEKQPLFPPRPPRARGRATGPRREKEAARMRDRSRSRRNRPTIPRNESPPWWGVFRKLVAACVPARCSQ
eukprot:s1489_g2.t1